MLIDASLHVESVVLRHVVVRRRKMRVKPQYVLERNPAAKPFLRSKNTDQLWFEGKKTGVF